MERMKKVEVVIESVYLNRLIELFKEGNVTGYTIVRDIEGAGGHGLKMADDPNDILSNTYVFTLCSEEKFNNMIEKIRAFIDKYGGKCIVIDADVLLHSKN